MRILKVPKKLQIVLGDEGTEGLLEMLDQQEEQTKTSVIETAADRFERRLTEVGSGLDNRITDVEARLRVEIANVEAGLRVNLAEVDSRIRTDLSTKIEKSKTETIRWMFIFYIGQVAALGGLLFALLR
jgi:hypothetical protein